jgi:hypothetical protein
MKPIMKYLLQNVYIAHMKGCWDPEFQPSEEEIVDSR